MNENCVIVSYKYVYDLYYRVRQACLKYDIYRLDFLDWVKAGVAYNTLGIKDISRRPSYFGRLYKAITSDINRVSEDEWREAVFKYYEDIFQLYQDHLRAQLKIASKRRGGNPTSPTELLIIPSFNELPAIRSVLETDTIYLKDYVCKNTEELMQTAATLFVTEDMLLFKGMALMFDYGVKRYGGGVTLEVK